MRTFTAVATLVALVIASVLASPAARAFTTFSGVTIFTPPSSYAVPRVLYARSLLLNQNKETDNVLLSTWENYGPEPPFFPIFRSTDGGQTWSNFSSIKDTQNGWGMRYQPFLYELPQAIGSFPAGTIIAAGNSIPKDLSQTKIDVYASKDKGKTWSFVSHVASGGKADPTNGQTPVWEPFLMVWKNQLVIYYSDQRDKAYGQKLVHQVTSDLYNWGSVVNDVAQSTYSDRPGMPVIAQLPNGQFILTYEHGATSDGFAAYYRLSADPLNFNSAPSYRIKSTDGTAPSSSPYVVWTPAGGNNGTISVSANSNAELFTNTALAAPGSPWKKVSNPQARAYTRSLRVMPDNKDILIIGAGSLGGSANTVSLSVVDITKL